MRAAALLILFLVLAPCAQAQELGRLFFTPQQRADLDARRKARVPDKPAAAAVASPVTRLDGYVKRSGGPSTVWINGESVTEGSPDAPRIDRGPSGSVSIGVGEGGGRVRMKPGESLDRGNGEVHDVIGDGEIQVRRKPQ
ncbi:MAG TPA: hypothetical protein VL199_20580 [Burkholderiales bacterium]|jgi:hypothetical protein|nr:hypothetical protein [Burkholderiales bacterium]